MVLWNQWSRVLCLLLAGVCCLAGVPCLAAYTLTVIPDRPHTMYALNQELRFQINVARDGVPVTTGAISFLLDGGLPDERDRGICLLGPEPVVLSTARSEPGIVRCHVTYSPPDAAPVSALAVVGVALELLRPSQPPPADFDAYWESQRAELVSLPLTITKRPMAVNMPDLLCEDVTISLRPDKPLRGYIARPVHAEKGSLPAILWLPFAGVSGAYQYHALYGAQQGALSMVINVLGLDNDLTQEQYLALEQGPLKHYPLRGREARDTYFYHDAYLMVWRALDYLTAQPEWNGKVLAVFGSSQGGALALAGAAFDRRVTLLAAAVPAMCDHTAFTVGRMAPWPDLIPRDGDPALQARVTTTAGYYDSVNFARRCTARTLFSVGFLDTVSPPTSVYAAFNQVSGKKSIRNEWALGHACSPEFEQLFFHALFPNAK